MTLSDSEINIVIAEACGWKDRPDPFYADKLAWTHDEGATWCSTIDLPDYCHDLNAMHEVLLTLNETQMFAFRAYLSEVMDDEFPERSTARQRAEAFLRVIGLWKE